MRLLGVGLRAGVLAVAALLVAAATAFGHAALLESTPSPGTRLEVFPREIKLQFTEPLNRGLSRATLVNAASAQRVPAAVEAQDRQLLLRPQVELGTAPYRVDWHTVSTEDGHALEGSFGFGVRTAATGGEHQLEQSPLARDGWLRIGLRWLFYAFLFYFAGGVFIAALVERGGPSGWLVPEPSRQECEEEPEASEIAETAWVRTLDAGLVASVAAAGVAVIEASDAGDGLSLQGLSDFLLSNLPGLARVGTVLCLIFAVAVARRLAKAAAGFTALAFLSIALSGHANSADPRALAILTDWTHLLAAAVWIGGIAQIAFTWLPHVGRSSLATRRALIQSVLPRFGRLALPAFLLVVSTGFSNALIELGHVEALWETGYGRVLAVKMALVGLIAAASYTHALRLRPRLLAANPHPPERRERRHWRLLASEPWLGAAVVGAAAVLVAFPLPPRQLSEASDAETTPAAACDPCPLSKPAANQLAVAEQAGPLIAAAWLEQDRGELSGRLRVLGTGGKPAAAKLAVRGATKQNACGPGCADFRVGGRPNRLEVVASKGRTRYAARIPVSWAPAGTARASRLLARAQKAMRELRSVREEEQITSGPGTFAATRYRLEAPDRFAYVTNSGSKSVTIGRYQWSRPPDTPWRKERYGGGGPPFRTRTWFRWTTYAQSVRLLGSRVKQGERLAELALFDRATPVWFRLTIDLATNRVLKARMIAPGHFMDQRYHAFNAPAGIEPPSTDVR
jgi:copper transport protein